MADVFDYVSEPTNFPRWNSAVRSVRELYGGKRDGVGATYLMERGAAAVGEPRTSSRSLERNRPTGFSIRTTSGPTPFCYRYRFRRGGRATLLELTAEVELGGLAGALGPLASRAVKRGVDSNFADLKRILEVA